VKHASLRTRLLLSFALVAGTGAATFFIAARFLVPRMFDDRMGNGMGGNGMGTNGSGAQHDALVSSVNSAMLIAVATTLVISTLIAVAMSRRTLRSVDELRIGASRLAKGDYGATVTRPREAELSDLADDLNHLAATLAATEHRRAALVGDVAHEMRTPLTTISGTLEGFDDGLFTQAELTQAVRTEIDRLRRLAADLAAASSADEGQLHLDLRHGDLSELLDTVATRFRPQFERARVRLDTRVEQGLTTRFDHDRLVQALSNLLSNALAYTPEGGTVEVRGSSSSELVTIRVTDSGRGLRTEELERVFERFYRADRDDRAGGTGIGLTISRAIARAHGGDLTAASPGPGLGSTFELTLPAT
jgi:histidine kinase